MSLLALLQAAEYIERKDRGIKSVTSYILYLYK